MMVIPCSFSLFSTASVYSLVPHFKPYSSSLPHNLATVRKVDLPFCFFPFKDSLKEAGLQSHL